jgi:hypothetical protein
MLANRTHRRTIIGAIVCALLASALTGVAHASANQRTHAALAQERYYSSYGDPEPLDVTAAQYAASKQPEPAPASGDSEPLDVTAAQYAASKQPEPASAPASVRFADTGDGIDPLPFVLGLVGALIVGVAAGTGMHQLVVRRRHATGLPA